MHSNSKKKSHTSISVEYLLVISISGCAPFYWKPNGEGVWNSPMSFQLGNVLSLLSAHSISPSNLYFSWSVFSHKAGHRQFRSRLVQQGLVENLNNVRAGWLYPSRSIDWLGYNQHVGFSMRFLPAAIAASNYHCVLSRQGQLPIPPTGTTQKLQGRNFPINIDTIYGRL